MLSLAFVCLVIWAQAPAFPGAEGHGRYTTGGRGGNVYHVTSLSGSASVRGSLPWALKQTGPRIIVFDVSGYIDLTADLKIPANTTIAGQTAPGDGITLRYYTVRPDANNVIIRFIRIRRGNAVDINDGADVIWTRNQSDMILDHCSFSWSIDEIASFYDNNRFTMQWCALAEALCEAGHDKGPHSYGGIWGGKEASFHHNFIAHCQNRVPRINGARYNWDGYDKTKFTGSIEAERVDLRNCVFYNWGDGNGAYGGPGGGYVNIVNNYYKAGPGTKNKTRVFQCSANHSSDSKGVIADGVSSKYYINGNYVTAASASQRQNYDWLGVIADKPINKDTIKLSAPIETGEVTTHSAEQAYEKVLLYVGASKQRDASDIRYMDEARNGTTTYHGTITTRAGIIDSQDNVGGWPELSTTATAPTDTDGDGMPDAWEVANGLNPNDASDGKTYTIDTQKHWYTNVEVYLNSLVEDIVRAQNQDAINSVNEYYPACVSASVNTIESGQDVAKVKYYTTNGIETKEPLPGVSIRKIVYTNGRTLTDKIIKM